jgi:hypothetical protein
MTGEAAFQVATTVVPVANVAKLGLAARLAGAGSRVTSFAGRAGGSLSRATSSAQRFVGAAKGRMNSAVRTSCRHSFSRATLVATAVGAVAIGSLAVGDEVLAYDETTGTTASYPVSVVHINDDPVTGTVVIAGEAIETTPEHPFYTLEAGWLDAEDLAPGMHVPSASGEPGLVGSVAFTADPATMYNLTVEVAHTFFVGEGEWLVHNCGPGDLPKPRVSGRGISHPRNGLDWEGPTHVYSIRGPRGTHKIGESAAGRRIVDGASKRGEAQVRRLARNSGAPHRSRVLKEFPTKSEARAYQTRLIDRMRRRHGPRALPGNLNRY